MRLFLIPPWQILEGDAYELMNDFKSILKATSVALSDAVDESTPGGGARAGSATTPVSDPTDDGDVIAAAVLRHGRGSSSHVAACFTATMKTFTERFKVFNSGA